MARVPVIFQKVLQGSQELGSSDEHMISRVFYFALIDGEKKDGYADLKLVVGSNFLTGDIEVCGVGGYSDFHAEQFRKAAADYYRKAVEFALSCLGIKVDANLKNVYMQENTITFTHAVDIETAKRDSRAW